ncbi:MAG TPA: DUF305 domain-containing protein [Candidatus Paceibacterota bacterium]|nr:DUF305 domain-containing protein [Candidatus Paceibacterota bacterium]
MSSMQNKIVVVGVAALVVGVVIGMYAVPAVVPDIYMSRGGLGIMGGNISSANIDQHFIEQMIVHHDDAIAMAELALERVTRPEIRTLAENIIAAQTSENEQMRRWYRDWFGGEVPDAFLVMGHGIELGMMHGGMMGDATDLTRLETAEPFEQAFIEEMIPHHQMAVMMAQMLKVGSARPEMQKLAEDIITAQTREIDQMRAWYRVWYTN